MYVLILYLITYATLQSYNHETMTACVRYYPNSKRFMHMHAKFYMTLVKVYILLKEYSDHNMHVF